MPGRGGVRGGVRHRLPRMAARMLGVALLAAVPGAALAQQGGGSQPPDLSPGVGLAPFSGAFPLGNSLGASQILTLDEDRLFSGSLWGKRAEREIAEASAALNAENRRIEAQLLAEERSLTDRRATMDPEAFRLEADAFDTRVTGIREAQDRKARAVTRQREAERRAFFAAALPVLSQVMRERGAVVMLDARAMFLADRDVDVTDELIAAVDERLGEGRAPDATEPAPETSETAVPEAPAPQPDAPEAP